MAAVVALALAVPLFTGGGGDEPALDLGGAPAHGWRSAPATWPRGSWRLEARRSDGICVMLVLTPGRQSEREVCRPLPGDRHLAFTATALLAAPAETVYLTWGLLSERTERVLVAPEGGSAWEVPALGAGRDLGGRFFVVHTGSRTPPSPRWRPTVRSWAASEPDPRVLSRRS